MNFDLKSIVPETTSFRQGEFKNDSTMIKKLPPAIKKKVLDYLKEPEPTWVSGKRMTDPITGEFYSHENLIREKDGFSWSSAAIYMLEKYDIRLSEEFLSLFREA